MPWTIKFHKEFFPEFESFSRETQDELLAEAKFIEMFGPETARPHVDTLRQSSFRNMKELRFEAEDGEWRVAFAFDPLREAILLVAGDKTGVSESRFYKRLIEKADHRYAGHLRELEAKGGEAGRSHTRNAQRKDKLK